MHTPNTAPKTAPPLAFSGATALTQLGVIRVTGTDATAFLQGQLTQDVLQMGLDQARLAAFCNAKGRMQASFVVFKRSPEEVLLVCSRDLLLQSLKRLGMFVMRAKASLSDATAEFKCFGLVGSAIGLIAASAGSAWAKADFDDSNLIFLPPAAGLARALWCVPASRAAAGSPMGPDVPALPAGVWDWLEVQSGIAMVTLPIFEAFVPQMLNYESIGGVSFKKGCYPGQEIVARSQFRGTLKRRTYLVHGAAGAAEVGDEVFQAADDRQPCGTVVASAAHPDGGFDALVSIQTAAATGEAGMLRLKSSTGTALELLALPYALLEDI